MNFSPGPLLVLSKEAEDWAEGCKRNRGDRMIFVKDRLDLMDGSEKAGSESGVEVLIFHVKAACGTQERMARAVCALTFQAFC